MTEPGLHRVSARVTDFAGNQNWARNAFSDRVFGRYDGFNGSLEKRIAVVDPLIHLMARTM